MNQKLANILKNLGLTDKESEVYLASLSLGPATILKLSQASGLKRTTIYSIIESLQQKGLMIIELHGWKKMFSAADPRKLEQVLENRKKELKSNLPELLSLYNLKGDESTLKYYEGLEAVKSVYESLIQDIKPHEDYFVITNIEEWLELDKSFFMDFIKRRAKLNINICLLFQESEEARKHQKFQQNYNEKVKILPRDNTFSVNLVITPQKVVINQMVPPIMAIVIENKNIIKVWQDIFRLLWTRLD